MNLLIFGATGETGRELVKQALAQGHIVSAFARDPAKLDMQHPNLKFFKGDVTDAVTVDRAMQGQDAVLSALGARTLKRSPALTQGIRHIVRSMEQFGVQRLVYQSALGVGDSRKHVSFLIKYLVIPLVLRNAIADHEDKEAAIKQSQLDWVIVRPAGLTNGPKTGDYRHGDPVKSKSLREQISRADVADFMLKQVHDDTYVHRMPGIEY